MTFIEWLSVVLRQNGGLEWLLYLYSLNGRRTHLRNRPGKFSKEDLRFMKTRMDVELLLLQTGSSSKAFKLTGTQRAFCMECGIYVRSG